MTDQEKSRIDAHFARLKEVNKAILEILAENPIRWEANLALSRILAAQIEAQKKAEREWWLDLIQGTVDVIGLIPVFGEPANWLSAGISYLRDDKLGVGLSLAASLPLFGKLAESANFARKTSKIKQYEEAIEQLLKFGLKHDEIKNLRVLGEGRTTLLLVTKNKETYKITRNGVERIERGLPGSLEHKLTRWNEYKGARPQGKRWSYERWSNVYAENMTRATRAHEKVNAFHRKLKWGRREVSVKVGKKTWRLDIADPSSKPPRGIEYKSGYQYLSVDNAWEIARDRALVKKGWKITWVFESTPSGPLLRELEKSGIKFASPSQVLK